MEEKFQFSKTKEEDLPLIAYHIKRLIDAKITLLKKEIGVRRKGRGISSTLFIEAAYGKLSRESGREEGPERNRREGFFTPPVPLLT